MKIKKSLLILLFVPLLYSCGEKKENSTDPKENLVENNCSISRIFDDVTICLPEINGMIESYSDTTFKLLIDKVAFANPGQIPIAAYVSESVININEESFPGINKYEGFGDYEWINIYSFHPDIIKEIFQNQHLTQKELKYFVDEYLAKACVNYTDVDIIDVNKKIQNATPYMDGSLSGKPILLQKYNLNSKIESVIMLMSFDNGNQTIYKLVLSNYLLIENKLICYTYTDKYVGQETIDNLRIKSDYFGLSMMQENN